MPDLTLMSTMGPTRMAELADGLLVLFVYPHATGLPDAPIDEWDLIPGARGCTAQACGFRDLHGRLNDLGADIAGLSVQTVEEQRAFAERVGIEYLLISDPGFELADALGLPTFAASGRKFYRRVTLIASRGRIVKAFSPILEPARNAAEVVAWLEIASP